MLRSAKKRKRMHGRPDEQRGAPSPAAPVDSLAAFVRAYSDGEDAPACIIALDPATNAVSIAASNAAFTRTHEHDLLQHHQDSSALLSQKSLHAGDVQWTITAVPLEQASGSTADPQMQTIVCMGRRLPDADAGADAGIANGHQDTNGATRTDEITVPASGTSQNAQVRAQYARTKQPQHYSTGSSTAEEWMQRWSKMDLPRTDKKAFIDHIDLLRSTDWAKTPLGPMDTWSTVLLSLLGQCLASPFPVLLAWGPELTQIYNLPYSYNILNKHPTNMGKSYADAWPEVWENLVQPTKEALRGRPTHVNNAQMFLQREDYLEECYFTWSMTPAYDDDGEIAGIYIPNFDNTLAVVTERRLRLLREASQASGVETKPAELYRRICKVVSRDPTDLPLLVFYDSSAADDEREMSEDSSEMMFEAQSFSDCNSHDEAPLPPPPHHHHQPHRQSSQSHDVVQDNKGVEQAGLASPGGQRTPEERRIDKALDNPKPNADDLKKATKPLSTLVRAAYSGCGTDSKLFPTTVPPPSAEAEEETSIATHPQFLKAMRKVQNTHEMVLLRKEDIADFVELLDVTSTGDKITTIAILPITTSDDTVRGICIVGLNPRKAYNDEYQVFLDLFQAQINHGVTSIRLVGEEIRRSRFFAALIKRKNEELHMVLEARTEELRNSEKKFIKMAEVCPSGIWTVDSTGHITFANEAWYNIIGHARDRPVDEWPETLHPEDKERCVAWFGNILKSKDPIHPIEFRRKQPEGATEAQRWIWGDARHDIDDNGEIVTITGTLTDITEKKMVELHQQQRAEEAIQMRHAQEGFVDMTSHELRNPLSAISLSSDATTDRLEHLLNSDQAKTLMSLYKTEVEETLQDMKIISHCCVHMTRLIDDVLTLSKLDNQFLVITPVPCRPADFISETLSIFKAELISKDITYELEIKPSFVAYNVDYVLTDPSRINQLVINILTNAIKFTATAKVRHIKITLDCSPTKPTTAGTSMQQTILPSPADAQKGRDADSIYLLVSISDTGRGLTQDEIGHLFQRFRQANPKTHISYGGSGLGLHICKRIAKLLGGEIGVESVRGQGSTFTFYIPTKRAQMPLSSALLPSPGLSTVQTGAASAEDNPFNATHGNAGTQSTRHQQQQGQQPLPSPAEESQNAFEKLALLIVEDNLVNQRLLDKHLTRVGCITTCANHGLEAIEMIKQSKWVRSDGPTIDCVLMDIEMPIMDGLAAIQQIRQMEDSGEIRGRVPVLAVTANARQEQLQIMVGSGFDGTISKPFKIPIIMDRVRTLLREMRSRQAKEVHRGEKPSQAS